ncbi:putative protein [Arabidopsis thaliana]|jgi:23S rRNA (pseudouridine1915-N3)-methyltransferase|uniref:Putative RNA methyltransferase At5g10620 n=2 Tax=Arabidopsis thaliana TaxID=3702 RepID=Y5620_ARATH|nr:methyltransferase [Arabidopsis thaliana]NP_196624.1 methyltransferase [Arabidopsis thaliana]Q9LXB4.1 RecName: Full=Putative RNA methyltransferase At5g10620 [Arabidopsis thaliana]AED91572.1 methyltransferase [Arabidopsis thaliana]ANM68739.1 methyltransferase [Arabidopsis thaliana]CAB89381.1 putative protein [Arabidopsis thaliana]|eukprot:NP_001318530.1 methyltransferase [Arabidopsis thaliana]
MSISVMANSHLNQPYASASPTPQEKGRTCRYAGQAVRALPIRVITVGKKRSEGVRLLVDEYKIKLKPYCSFEDSLVRSNPRNAQDVRAQVEDEEVAMMKLIGSDDWVVVLDERGRDIDSEQMAELLGDAGNSGASRISFCIGGAYGHGTQVRKRANVTIRLSSMVLNHQIALVVLMEQLYRSWTILKGQNYHH